MKDWERRRYEDASRAYAALMQFYPRTLSDLPRELWKIIPAFDDYQISNFGRVRRFYKKAAPQIIKPVLHSTGRLCVNLWKNGKSKPHKIHRLVAKAFVPNPDDKREVNHIDGHPLNCHFSNLEWVSSKENHLHAVATGLYKSGEDNRRAVLTNEQAALIRLNPDNLTTVALAETFGIDQTTVSNIQLGKSYKTAGGTCRVATPRKSRVLLTDAEKEELRRLRASDCRKYTVRVLAKIFNIGATAVRRILNEKKECLL